MGVLGGGSDQGGFMHFIDNYFWEYNSSEFYTGFYPDEIIEPYSCCGYKCFLGYFWSISSFSSVFLSDFHFFHHIFKPISSLSRVEVTPL